MGAGGDMNALRLIVPPPIKPVTLAEAKAHLRVDNTDEDALINILIDAATSYIDGPTGFLGRALVDQTWELLLDAFPVNEIKIPIPPLLEVVTLNYFGTDGIEVTLNPAAYTVDDVNEPGWIVPDGTWPATFNGINSVVVRFRAGYVDTTISPANDVPGDIKAALLLYLGSLYANREQVIAGVAALELPWGADQLLRRKRIDLSMA
jgi:uncharacterized phiE125 gp8 family phage protein